ncbi:MAG: S-layer homology domain-containing protein [Clostridia bacterium]|nr:S-layer homology domain-containing protein [Clostridia bacterium]
MKSFFSILLTIAMVFSLFPSALSATVFATDSVTEEVDLDSVYAVMEKIEAIGNVTIHSGNRIKEARAAYDDLTDSQKELVENFSILTDAEATISEYYIEASNKDYAAVFDATVQYLSELGTPCVGSVGGEWMVLCLTRSEHECPEAYYENVITYVNENINDKNQLHRAKSTDNSRVILALTSAGYDVTNVDGHNLLLGLSDMNYLKKQGVNGPIWALIAFDSYGYEIPENDNPDTQATREEIISYILEKQLPDGGWSIYGQASDPDMTGMAIVALAPYYHTNPDVAGAIETALDCLSNLQHENGGFGSIDGSCVESCAQVIVALTALGIDPETEERLIKNDISVVDALCIYAVDGGGFEHMPGSGFNGMATEQGGYALVSYLRFLEGKTALYDMTDVTIFNEESSEDADNDEAWEDEPEVETPDIWEEEMAEEDLEAEEETTIEASNNGQTDVSSEDFSSNTSNDTPQPTDAEKFQPTEKNPEEAPSETKEITVENENAPEVTNLTFADVKPTDWYYESVKYVSENNLMQGTDTGFEPNSKMTRAMLVTALYRMKKAEKTEAIHNFSDVPEGLWYTDAVRWAVKNHIVNGVSETKFMPEQEVTREQMALMFWRYAKLQGMDVSTVSDLTRYTDANDISNWALDAFQWANALSLLQGTDETTLSPKDTATRAQVATIMMRFFQIAAN